MRISRPCYDKYHRCPGWAGGGLKYAKRVRCDDGSIVYNPDARGWRWRPHRCNRCPVIVLPYVIRWADPTWWRSCVPPRRARDWWDRVRVTRP